MIDFFMTLLPLIGKYNIDPGHRGCEALRILAIFDFAEGRMDLYFFTDS